VSPVARALLVLLAGGCGGPDPRIEPLQVHPTEVRFVDLRPVGLRVRPGWDEVQLLGDPDFDVDTSTSSGALRVFWSPRPLTSGRRHGELQIRSQAHGEVRVPMWGSTIRGPRVEWAEPGPLRRGPVRAGTEANLRVGVANHGRTAARLGRLWYDGVGARVRGPEAVVVPGLAERWFDVPVRWSQGEVEGQLRWTGPDAPTAGLVVTAQGVAPALSVEPEGLVFAPTLVGDERTAHLRLEPAHQLPVDVVAVAWDGGEPFATDLEPTTLTSPRAVRVRFRPTEGGTVHDTLSVTVRSTAGEFTTAISVRGAGVECAAWCPLPHATVDCRPRCRVVSCAAGWVDANRSPDDGCECSDPDDVGATCDTLLDLGRLADDGASRVVHQRTAGPDDVDLFRLHVSDGFHLFREDFDVTIEVEGAGVELCVARSPGRAPEGWCALEAWECPPDGRMRWGGRWAVDDEATLWLRIRGATCGSYVLRARNG
jgi:hypothetical protein